jgi:hypothetical protein
MSISHQAQFLECGLWAFDWAMRTPPARFPADDLMRLRRALADFPEVDPLQIVIRSISSRVIASLVRS